MVNQFQSNNELKPQKPASNSTYNQILSLVKTEPLFPKRIKQNIHFSFPAITKQLNKLIKAWEVIKIENKKGYKEVLIQAYREGNPIAKNIPLNPKVKNYYLYTPQSAKLFLKLKNNTNGIINAELLIEDIMTSFQILEFKSKFEYYTLFNEKAIKKQYSTTKKDNLKKIKENNKAYLNKFLDDTLNIKSILPIVDVNDKKYINLDNILIKREVFISFLDIFYSEMNSIMRLTSYLPEGRYECSRIIEKMSSLFILIVKDSNFRLFNEPY